MPSRVGGFLFLLFASYLPQIILASVDIVWQLQGHELHLTSVRNENAYFRCIRDIGAASLAVVDRFGGCARYSQDTETCTAGMTQMSQLISYY